MRIARFEPWPYAEFLQRDPSPRAAQKTRSDWVPAVDIIEEKDHFLLRADVPGVNAEDIDVSMDAAVLTVSGVRHPETRGEKTELRRAERSKGHFLRSFTLPETARPDGISAKSSNGILEISIPKQPEIQARRITVEAA